MMIRVTSKTSSNLLHTPKLRRVALLRSIQTTKSPMLWWPSITPHVRRKQPMQNPAKIPCVSLHQQQ